MFIEFYVAVGSGVINSTWNRVRTHTFSTVWAVWSPWPYVLGKHSAVWPWLIIGNKQDTFAPQLGDSHRFFLTQCLLSRLTVWANKTVNKQDNTRKYCFSTLTSTKVISSVLPECLFVCLCVCRITLTSAERSSKNQSEVQNRSKGIPEILSLFCKKWDGNHRNTLHTKKRTTLCDASYLNECYFVHSWNFLLWINREKLEI